MGTITLEQIHEDLTNLRLDVLEVKARLDEEFKLSPQAKKDLEEARREMKHAFISHDEIMKKFG